MVKAKNGSKDSSNWLKPVGVFYPDNNAKYIPPLSYFDKSEKTQWWKNYQGFFWKQKNWP